jgi:dienelactone hydrolase
MRKIYGVRKIYVAGAALVGAFLAVAVGWPALTLSLALAVPVAQRALAPLYPEPASFAVTVESSDGPLAADLYRPRRPRSALVLVHGLSRDGRKHPELTRLARLLAGREIAVLVPHFAGMAAFTLSGRETLEVSAALAHARGLGVPVGVAGFSFGAGPALLAAASAPDVRVVGSFGGYADLRHVIRYVTTGVHELDGRRYVQTPEPYNRWKLLALLAGFVKDPAERVDLQAVVARRLRDPSDDTSALETRLGPTATAMLALARARDDVEVARRLAALPTGARDALDALSPLPAAGRLNARLLIAHGAADASIPFTESLRLAAAAGPRARVAVLRTFHHVGPRPFWTGAVDRAVDGWDLFRLIDALLTG